MRTQRVFWTDVALAILSILWLFAAALIYATCNLIQKLQARKAAITGTQRTSAISPTQCTMETE